MDDKTIKKENVNDDNVDMTCIPDEGKYKEGPFNPKDVPQDGTYKEHMSPKEKILQRIYTTKQNVNYQILK